LGARLKILAAILGLALSAGLYEFFDADLFFVSQVDVQGLNILAKSEVERASGLIGYNAFFVEPSQVERAVQKMPEIKSAHVMIGFPSSALVQIEERVPELVWFAGDSSSWVDGEGIAFRARLPRPELPTLRDLNPTGVQPGKRVNPAAFNTVRALRAAWTDSPKSFEWSSSIGLATVDEHGWKILLGDASDMELKVQKLKALVSRLQTQGTRVKFIDLGKGDPYYQ
jgi:cell division septal protein FtsQ